MKKFLSILLAAMLVLAMVGTAVAEETATYTITITGDKGHTYEAYQIFSGDLAGNVLSNIKLGNGTNENILDFNGNQYGSAALLAEALTSENAEAFATLVSANLATVAGTSQEADGVYTIANLAPGYYFIKDKDGSVPTGGAYTKFMVKIVKDVNATPKTDNTVSIKKVKENVKPVNGAEDAGFTLATQYNDVADYCIGDTVPFSLYSKVPDLKHFKTYKMTFHDQMSAGLTFDATSVKVFVGGTEIASDLYTVNAPAADGCTFDVTILNLVGKDYAKGAEIRVDFNATLNEQAVVGLEGNPNQSKLEFSNNPNDETSTTETPWDYVVVFTYKLDVTKVDGANPDVVLADAEFVLKNAAGSFVTVDADGKVTGWVATQAEASVLKSDETGKFSVIGLDDGEYELVETKAPAGYNLLASPVKVVIKATTVNNQTYANKPADALTAIEVVVNGNAATPGNVDEGSVAVTIENNSGATLPETGGIGTTIFYLLGSIMFIGAAMTLVVRRRADADEV